jgi:ABC-type dipeptide/oligopeptide/nickel transport system ATPase component
LMNGTSLLSVDDLTVTYAGPQGRFRAVDRVSFTIQPGEIFGLVGESGSGKTTTAMAILRLIKPPALIDSGRIVMNGLDMLQQHGESLRRLRWSTMSLIPQGAQNALNPVIRVGEQVADAISSHEAGQSRSRSRTRVAELLAMVDLPEKVARMYAHELSGGMKQRVCIAMAIALHPALIVADEPTSALDVVVQRAVAQTLKDIQARLGVAVLLIGHDMGLQAQMVDRLGVMYRGHLVEVGPVRAVFKSPLHPYTQRLIASLPSLTRTTPLSDFDAGRHAERLDFSAISDEFLPLREIQPGHFVATNA